MHYLEGMRKSLAVLIVGVFLFSAFSVAGNSISDTTNLIEDNSADMLVEIIEQGEVEVLGDEPLLQPRENTVADRTPNEYPNSGQLVKVAIATTNVKELATFLSDVEYNGLIGTNSNQAGMAVPILDVPIDCIAGISSLPSTIAVYEPNERV
ncbi:MAG: hypothetical protein KAJ64_05135, partial [Thermoplasmata archaeon]|nr:hypothetical protein [Thermoplasmata archaeon]